MLCAVLLQGEDITSRRLAGIYSTPSPGWNYVWERERRGDSLWPEGERQMFLFYKGKRMREGCVQNIVLQGGEMKNYNKQKRRK